MNQRKTQNSKTKKQLSIDPKNSYNDFSLIGQVFEQKPTSEENFILLFTRFCTIFSRDLFFCDLTDEQVKSVEQICKYFFSYFLIKQKTNLTANVEFDEFNKNEFMNFYSKNVTLTEMFCNKLKEKEMLLQRLNEFKVA